MYAVFRSARPFPPSGGPPCSASQLWFRWSCCWPARAAADAPAIAAPSLRRLPRHPQLPRVRRRRHPRLRHRRRPQVRQAHRHAGQPARTKPDNIKGVCACAATKQALLHHADEALLRRPASPRRRSGRRRCRSGCDRMSITPDGKMLYVPSFEKDTWNVVDAATGDVIDDDRDEERRAQHGLRPRRHADVPGRAEVAAACSSPTRRRTRSSSRSARSAARSGRSRSTAPQTLCFVNVNELLGFEIGDLKTGKMLHRVEVQGFKKGTVKRHGCPSHGIGLTPDEKEVWVVRRGQRAGARLRRTVMPPKQTASINAPRAARLGDVQPRRQATPTRRPAR